MRRPLGPIVIALLIPALAACGGGNSPSASATSLVSSSGGSITSTDGHLRLSVPSGALSSPTKITIRALDQGEWPKALRDAHPIGTVYSLEPNGLQFAAPVTVSIDGPPVVVAIGGHHGLPILVTIPGTGADQIAPLTSQPNQSSRRSNPLSVTATTSHFSDVAEVNVVSYDLKPGSESALVGGEWSGTVTITDVLPASVPVQIEATGDLTASGAVDVSTNLGGPSGFGSSELSSGDSYTANLTSWFCPHPGVGTFGVNFHIAAADLPTQDVYYWSERNPRRVGDDVLASAPASCSPPPTTTSSSTSSTTTSSTTTTTAAPKYPGPIAANFDQAAYSTVYSEPVTDPNWTYQWSLQMQADPECASGFTPNSPAPNQADWFHADKNPTPPEPQGPCDHKFYGANGHPGVVTLVVIGPGFRCQAQYSGTVSGTSNPPQCIRT